MSANPDQILWARKLIDSGFKRNRTAFENLNVRLKELQKKCSHTRIKEGVCYYCGKEGVVS